MKKIGRAKRIKMINQNNLRLTPKSIRKYVDDNYVSEYNEWSIETHPFIDDCTDNEIAEVITLFKKTTKAILTMEYIADYFLSFFDELRLKGRIFDRKCTLLSNIKAHQEKRHRAKVMARLEKEYEYEDDDYTSYEDD